MILSLPMSVGMFGLAAVGIVGAAVFLTTAADIIATRMGLGRLWVGSLLLAGATSLPELATAVAAAMAGSANLAAGNMLGANMLNMSNLAILLALLGGREVFQRLAPQQILVAASAIILTGLATIFAGLKTDVGWLGLSAPGVILLAVYLVLSGVLRKASTTTEEVEEGGASHSLRWAWLVFIACAAVIFIAGPLLAFSSQRIADLTGIGASFVGVLGLALVTTLPELTTTFTAFRMGAHDMAVANMYGTNSFNIAALAVADLAFPNGSLFGDLDISTTAAGLFATCLMALGGLQILRRRPMKLFSLKEPSPSLFVALYVLGLFIVFQSA